MPVQRWPYRIAPPGIEPKFAPPRRAVRHAALASARPATRTVRVEGTPRKERLGAHECGNRHAQGANAREGCRLQRNKAFNAQAYMKRLPSTARALAALLVLSPLSVGAIAQRPRSPLLSPCAIAGVAGPAFCGEFHTRERPGDAASRPLALNVVVLPATTDTVRGDPLTFLAGRGRAGDELCRLSRPSVSFAPAPPRYPPRGSARNVEFEPFDMQRRRRHVPRLAHCTSRSRRLFVGQCCG